LYIVNDIIIHGASSFVGKNFLKRLIDLDCKTIILARHNSKIDIVGKNIKIVRYSQSLSEIDEAQITVNNPVFFDFAWYGVFGSDRNDEKQFTINIPLIISSIVIAKKLNTKHWVSIGSQAEYGNLNKEISETDDCKPTSLYGKAKLLCSQISADLCKEFGIEHSWLRLFSVYGPDDNHEWFIQYLIKQMTINAEINVTLAEQEWDFLFIDDVINALCQLISSNGIGIANLGSGKSVALKYIIETLKKTLNSQSKINYGAVPYREDQVMFMQANIRKLTSNTHWNPQIDIDMGLKFTAKKYLKL
jgi:UDP-glucose 4-epimerase